MPPVPSRRIRRYGPTDSGSEGSRSSAMADYLRTPLLIVTRLTLVLVAGVALVLPVALVLVVTLVLPGAAAELVLHGVLCVLLSFVPLLRMILRLPLGVAYEVVEFAHRGLLLSSRYPGLR